MTIDLQNRQNLLSTSRIFATILQVRQAASVEMSIERVAERVAHGGHDIPRNDIIRRYPRSITNLLEHYSPLCISTICLDNSGPTPEVVFMQDTDGRVVESQALFDILLKRGEI